MDIKDKNVRSYSLKINSQTGEITIRQGNYCCAKSSITGFCAPCSRIYCRKCQTWKSLEIFIGNYKRKGDSCADCRDIKYSIKNSRSLPLNLRFEVLNRDNFTCRYCGQSAPKVELHVDHIIPVSKGGENSLNNLITACQDCNLGKSDMLLESE